MKTDQILILKDLLAKKKSRLNQKEKILKDKERKHRTRKLIELGGLISKAELEHLNEATLLGALLEIKEKLSNESINSWTLKGEKALQNDREINFQPLIISFETEPTLDIKNMLRENRFRWNAFRKEWYGHGKKDQMDQLLKNQRVTVEIAK